MCYLIAWWTAKVLGLPRCQASYGPNKHKSYGDLVCVFPSSCARAFPFYQCIHSLRKLGLISKTTLIEILHRFSPANNDLKAEEGIRANESQFRSTGDNHLFAQVSAKRGYPWLTCKSLHWGKRKPADLAGHAPFTERPIPPGQR